MNPLIIIGYDTLIGVNRRQFIIDTLKNDSVDQLYVLLLGVIDSVKNNSNDISIDTVNNTLNLTSFIQTITFQGSFLPRIEKDATI